MEEIRQQHPEAIVELWAQDEGRHGLKPILQSCWARKGVRPVAKQKRGFKSVYVSGIVQPKTGKVHWLIVPKLTAAIFSIILKNFAEQFDIGLKRRAIIVLDQAGWHTSGKLVIPEGIHLIFQPAYSPEVQPAEHLWPPLREPVANRVWTNLEDVEEALEKRCRELADDPERLRSTTHFWWWPD